MNLINLFQNWFKISLLGAAQCKLARIMFALLKYKKYYDPEVVAENTIEQAVA